MTETLEILAAEFLAHRGGRAQLAHGKGYPVDLRRRAVSMLDHYDGKTLATRLGLSSVAILKRWVQGRGNRREESNPTMAAAESSRAFIELCAASDQPTAMAFCAPATPLEVEMIDANGVRLLVRGAGSERIVHALARQMLDGSMIRSSSAAPGSSRA